MSRAFNRILPLWLIFVTFLTSTSMITPFLGLYVLSLGATTLFVGAVYATNSVVSFLARLPISSLADRYGNRVFIILGLICNLVGVSLYILIPNIIFAILARALQGAAIALFTPSTLSYLARLRINGRTSAEVVSYTSTGAALGQSLGPALGAALFVAGSFLNLFLSSLAICALGTALAVISVKSDAPLVVVAKNESVVARSKAILTKQFSLTLYSRAAISYVSGMVVVLIPLLVTLELKLSESDVGVLFTLAAISNLLARPISGKFSSRIGESQFLEIGSLLTGLAAILYLLSFSSVVLWVAMIVYGFGLGIFIPSSILYVDRTVPNKDLTLGMGIMTTMIDVGMAAGSAISTIILAQMGFNWAFVVAAVVGFSGLVSQRISRGTSGL